MDTLNHDRQIIKQVLAANARFYTHDQVEYKLVVDSETDSYLIISLGWDGVKRIHSCMVHLDIIEGKIWVQRDDTEDGITPELVEAGIPKDRIVLGFHLPDVRPHTGFAIA